MFLISTKEQLPFEDKHMEPNFQHRLILKVGRRNGTDKSKRYDIDNMYWKVIDPSIGVSYEAQFDNARHVFNAHCLKYETNIQSYSLKDDYKNRMYWYSVLEINQMLIIRVFRYNPIMSHPDGYFYELERIIFYKDKGYVESRAGVRMLIESDIYSRKSIYHRCIRLFDDDLTKHKDSDSIYNIIQRCDFCAKEYILSTRWFYLKSITRYYFAYTHKQHFNSNVPDEIKAHLNNADEKDLDGFLCLKYQQGLGYQSNLRLYIGKEHIYWFKQNIAGQWNSSNKHFCAEMYKATPRQLHFDLRKKKKLFKGTLYEKYEYRTGWNTGGLIETLDMQRHYLCIEQAIKMRRDDIARALIGRVKFYEKQKHSRYKKTRERCECFKVSPNASLPEVLGITGHQIKLIAYPVYVDNWHNGLGSLSAFIHNKCLAERIPLETRLALVQFDFHDILSVPDVENLDAEPTKWIRKDISGFYKALAKLAKKDLFEAKRLLTEYLDYTNRLYRPAKEFIEQHPEYQNVQLKFFLKLSQVHAYHERAFRLIQEANQIKTEEQNRWWRENCNKMIATERKKNENLEFSDKNFTLILPDTKEQIISEGATLCHCVGGYVKSVANGETIIMFLRQQSDLKKPYFTMEIYNGAIRQFFGYHDSYNQDPNVADFVKRFAKEKNLVIDCLIYRQKTS